MSISKAFHAAALACLALTMTLTAPVAAEQVVEPVAEQSQVSANNALVVEVYRDMETIDLTQHMSLFADPDGNFSIEEIVARRDFVRWQKPSANFGFERAAYWVAVTLHNNQSRELPLVFRQDYPLIDYLDFWYPDANGVWRLLSTGDQRVFSSRAIESRDFLFPLTMAPHAQQTIYFRFRSNGPLNIGLSVSTTEGAIARTGNEQLLYGAYYGGFLVLIIYNLIIFLAVRDRAYIYYMVYAVSYGLYMAVHNGLAFQFIWPDSPWLANQSLLILLGISLLFAMHFSRVVCATQRLAPKTDRLAVVLQIVSLALLLVTPFFSYQQLIFAYSVQTLFVSCSILALGIICLLRGSLPARYFMMAWITFLLGVIIYMFKQFGWLGHNFFTQNSFQMGSLIEMVLLSLALSARVTEMKKLGYLDALTSLANRRHFDEVLPREFSFANSSGSPLSILVLDIDHFKKINDEHGHLIGDEVIEGIGRLLRKDIRKPSLACRYGGEEFAVLLPRTGPEQALQLAQRLRAQVVARPMAGVSLTVSVGVATLLAHEFEDALQLFDAADSALYRAKSSGRNQVQVYQPLSPQRRDAKSGLVDV